MADQQGRGESIVTDRSVEDYQDKAARSSVTTNESTSAVGTDSGTVCGPRVDDDIAQDAGESKPTDKRDESDDEYASQEEKSPRNDKSSTCTATVQACSPLKRSTREEATKKSSEVENSKLESLISLDNFDERAIQEINLKASQWKKEGTIPKLEAKNLEQLLTSLVGFITNKMAPKGNLGSVETVRAAKAVMTLLSSSELHGDAVSEEHACAALKAMTSEVSKILRLGSANQRNTRGSSHEECIGILASCFSMVPRLIENRRVSRNGLDGLKPLVERILSTSSETPIPSSISESCIDVFKLLFACHNHTNTGEDGNKDDAKEGVNLEKGVLSDQKEMFASLLRIIKEPHALKTRLSLPFEGSSSVSISSLLLIQCIQCDASINNAPSSSANKWSLLFWINLLDNWLMNNQNGNNANGGNGVDPKEAIRGMLTDLLAMAPLPGYPVATISLGALVRVLDSNGRGFKHSEASMRSFACEVYGIVCAGVASTSGSEPDRNSITEDGDSESGDERMANAKEKLLMLLSEEANEKGQSKGELMQSAIEILKSEWKQKGDDSNSVKEEKSRLSWSNTSALAREKERASIMRQISQKMFTQSGIGSAQSMMVQKILTVAKNEDQCQVISKAIQSLTDIVSVDVNVLLSNTDISKEMKILLKNKKPVVRLSSINFIKRAFNKAAEGEQAAEMQAERILDDFFGEITERMVDVSIQVRKAAASMLQEVCQCKSSSKRNEAIAILASRSKQEPDIIRCSVLSTFKLLLNESKSRGRANAKEDSSIAEFLKDVIWQVYLQESRNSTVAFPLSSSFSIIGLLEQLGDEEEETPSPKKRTRRGGKTDKKNKQPEADVESLLVDSVDEWIQELNAMDEGSEESNETIAARNKNMVAIHVAIESRPSIMKASFISTELLSSTMSIIQHAETQHKDRNGYNQLSLQISLALVKSAMQTVPQVNDSLQRKMVHSISHIICREKSQKTLQLAIHLLSILCKRSEDARRTSNGLIHDNSNRLDKIEKEESFNRNERNVSQRHIAILGMLIRYLDVDPSTRHAIVSRIDRWASPCEDSKIRQAALRSLGHTVMSSTDLLLMPEVPKKSVGMSTTDSGRSRNANALAVSIIDKFQNALRGKNQDETETAITCLSEIAHMETGIQQHASGSTSSPSPFSNAYLNQTSDPAILITKHFQSDILNLLSGSNKRLRSRALSLTETFTSKKIIHPSDLSMHILPLIADSQISTRSCALRQIRTILRQGQHHITPSIPHALAQLIDEHCTRIHQRNDLDSNTAADDDDDDDHDDDEDEGGHDPWEDAVEGIRGLYAILETANPRRVLVNALTRLIDKIEPESGISERDWIEFLFAVSAILDSNFSNEDVSFSHERMERALIKHAATAEDALRVHTEGEVMDTTKGLVADSQRAKVACILARGKAILEKQMDGEQAWSQPQSTRGRREEDCGRSEGRMSEEGKEEGMDETAKWPSVGLDLHEIMPGRIPKEVGEMKCLIGLLQSDLGNTNLSAAIESKQQTTHKRGRGRPKKDESRPGKRRR